MARIPDHIVVLGAGGKMGPSICRLARAALDAAGRQSSEVFAVSRWSDEAVRASLETLGVRSVVADLLSEQHVAALPDAASVVFMAGAKFGTTTDAARTWATNTLVPAFIARRYPTARIAAFSSGNVYPLVEVSTGGSRETDELGAAGEYAMSCVARERIFEHASQRFGATVTLLRLNYAVDLRYGVLADIASLLRDDLPIDLTTGHANVVWQGYANEIALRSLALASSPPFRLNVTGPETLSIREVAQRLGAMMGRFPRFVGTEASTALLSDASACFSRFGMPAVTAYDLECWQASWHNRGGQLWAKPTHFQTRDGKY